MRNMFVGMSMAWFLYISFMMLWYVGYGIHAGYDIPVYITILYTLTLTIVALIIALCALVKLYRRRFDNGECRPQSLDNAQWYHGGIIETVDYILFYHRFRLWLKTKHMKDMGRSEINMRRLWNISLKETREMRRQEESEDEIIRMEDETYRISEMARNEFAISQYINNYNVHNNL